MNIKIKTFLRSIIIWLASGFAEPLAPSSASWWEPSGHLHILPLPLLPLWSPLSFPGWAMHTATLGPFCIRFLQWEWYALNPTSAAESTQSRFFSEWHLSGRICCPLSLFRKPEVFSVTWLWPYTVRCGVSSLLFLWDWDQSDLLHSQVWLSTSNLSNPASHRLELQPLCLLLGIKSGAGTC